MSALTGWPFRRERMPAAAGVGDRVVATKLEIDRLSPARQCADVSDLVTNKAGQGSRGRTHTDSFTHAPKDQYTLHVKAAQEGASNVTVMAVDSVRVSE